MDPAAVAGLDVVFLAMPHGASQGFAPHIVDDVAHVVDLGADFRLPAATYAQWYGDDHTAPELIDRFGYGLVELYRERARARSTTSRCPAAIRPRRCSRSRRCSPRGSSSRT